MTPEQRSRFAAMSYQEKVDLEVRLRREWLDRVGRDSAAYHARSRSGGAGVRCYHDFAHPADDPAWGPSDEKWAQIEAAENGQTVDAGIAAPTVEWEPEEIGVLPQYPNWPS